MTPGRHRRGLTLVAVLVIMGGALLVATSLLFVAQTEIAGSAGAAGRVQSHALAWSGVQAVMVRLDEQRDEILEGRLPQLDEQHDVYETATRLGVVRLLEIGPGGERLVPQASKLDLEHVDGDMLAATGLIDDALAGAVVEHRQTLGRPYQSEGELLDVPGVSIETLYGPIDEIAAPRDAGDAPSADPMQTSLRGLADVVTVYGFEPALQRDGRLRINLNVPWSEELGERVAQRFDVNVSETLQRLIESGTTFESEARIFEVMNFFELPLDEWPDVVDTFTTDEGEFHFGRLDINSAPYEALLALPGVEAEQAGQIVRVRDTLPDDERENIAWPAIQGIIPREAYPQLAGRITTRSWTYRLRLAAGEVDPDDPDAPLENRVVYEVVIDLSAPRARVAYLRDVTWLRPTVLIAAGVSLEPTGSPIDNDRDDPSEDATDTGRDAERDEANADEPLDDEPSSFEQPDDPEPVSPDGDDAGTADAPGPPGPPGTPPSPARRRIGRWTAG